jgi:hypothetical protein
MGDLRRGFNDVAAPAGNNRTTQATGFFPVMVYDTANKTPRIRSIAKGRIIISGNFPDGNRMRNAGTRESFSTTERSMRFL